VIGATQFLTLVDSLMVAVALPVINRDLSLTATELPWVVNAYTLLTAATVLAAVAPFGSLLVVARAVQGLSAGIAQPASLALVPTLFPREPKRSQTFGIVGMADGLGSVVGALAGGVVTGLLGWRWVFLTTVPLGLGALLLARAVLPEHRQEGAPRRLDLPGAVLATAGLTAVVYAIIQVERAGPASPAVLVPLAAGGAALAGFVRVERRAAEPLVRLPPGWPSCP
jgi:MFS family permease